MAKRPAPSIGGGSTNPTHIILSGFGVTLIGVLGMWALTRPEAEAAAEPAPPAPYYSPMYRVSRFMDPVSGGCIIMFYSHKNSLDAHTAKIPCKKFEPASEVY